MTERASLLIDHLCAKVPEPLRATASFLRHEINNMIAADQMKEVKILLLTAEVDALHEQLAGEDL